MVTKDRYLGIDSSHLVKFTNPGESLEFFAEASSIKALRALIDDASLHGINIRVASAFRSFQRQFTIVSEKFFNKRAILDENENVLNTQNLTDKQKVDAILRFSAVPGFSRHHFGTDFDIYAINLLPDGQKLQLTAKEYDKDSYFYPLGVYLDENLEKFGFIRPFTGKGAIGFEPWHISYKQEADKVLKEFDLEEALSFLNSFDEPWIKYAIDYIKGHKFEIFGE